MMHLPYTPPFGTPTWDQPHRPPYGPGEPPYRPWEPPYRPWGPPYGPDRIYFDGR